MEDLIKHLESLKYKNGRKYLFHYAEWDNEKVITVME